ncbi:MAG TPA: Clp protease N-terminal domain-containing protein [Candidatus Dormibacteraeota bacterium]|nr:Clp protease N-terminal domain-containing protein [Candidatus Dormibacteraeota bacterium]
MFERFTDSARDCVTGAQDEARGLGHRYIGTEHLLAALTRDERGLGGRVARDLGLTHDDVREDIRQIIGPGDLDADALATIGIDLDEVRRRVEETFGPGALDRCDPSGHIPFTPRSKKALELSLREAVQLGDKFIGSEHVLLGIARVDDGVGARILSEHGITRKRVEYAVNEARRAA